MINIFKHINLNGVRIFNSGSPIADGDLVNYKSMRKYVAESGSAAAQATGIQTFPAALISNTAVSLNQQQLIAHWVRALNNTTITTMEFFLLNNWLGFSQQKIVKMAIYTLSGNTLTRVGGAATVQVNIWKANGSFQSATLSQPAILEKGQVYYMVIFEDLPVGGGDISYGGRNDGIQAYGLSVRFHVGSGFTDLSETIDVTDKGIISYSCYIAGW